jgi:hypothetical protein
MEKLMKNKLIFACLSALLVFSTSLYAGEGRYQAYWNGKNYLILDTDNGHMWAYFGDTMMYNGRIDGNDFISPEKPKIWVQKHGKWVQQ